MNNKSADRIFVPFEQRPKCEVENCFHTVEIYNYLKSGMPMWRRVSGTYMCGLHHKLSLSKKQGFENVTEYANSKHRYRKNRKNYCENNTGMGIWIDPESGKHRFLHEIGVICTATITHNAMLSVDHINGDNHDDNENNHQTLCHNCHKIKTILSKDSWSADRKIMYLKNING